MSDTFCRKRSNSRMVLKVVVLVILFLTSAVYPQTITEGITCSSGHNIAQWLIDSDTNGIKSLKLTCTDSSYAIINGNTGNGALCIGQVNSISYAVNPFSVLVYLSLSCNGTVVSFGVQGDNVQSIQSCQSGNNFGGIFISRNSDNIFPPYLIVTSTTLLQTATCNTPRPLLAGSFSTISISVASNQVVSSSAVLATTQAIGTESLLWRLTSPVSQNFGCLRYLNGTRYQCLQSNNLLDSSLISLSSNQNVTIAINLKQMIRYPSLVNYNSASVVSLQIFGQFRSIYSSVPLLAFIPVSVNVQSIAGSYNNPAAGFVSRSNQGSYTGDCPFGYYVLQVTYNVDVITGYILAVSFTCIKYFNISWQNPTLAVAATQRAVTSGNGLMVVSSMDNAPIDGITLNYGPNAEAVPIAISFSSPFISNNSPITDNLSFSSSCLQQSPPFGYLPNSMTTVVNSEGFVEAIGVGCGQVWTQVNFDSYYTVNGTFLQSNVDFSWNVTISMMGLARYIFSDMGSGFDFRFNASIGLQNPELPLQNISPAGSLGEFYGTEMVRNFTIPFGAWSGSAVTGTLVLDIKGDYGWMYTFYVPILITPTSITNSSSAPPLNNIVNPGTSANPVAHVTNGNALLGSFSTVYLKVFANQTVSTISPFNITGLQPVVDEIPSWRLIKPVDVSVGCLRYKVNNRAFCLQNGTALPTNTMTSSNITFSLNLRMIIQNYPSGFSGNNYQLVFQGQLESIYTNATVPLSIVVNVDFLNLLASLQTYVPVLGLVTADNSLSVQTTVCPTNFFVTQMRVNRQVGTGYIKAVGFQCGTGNLFYSNDKDAITYYSLNATGVGVSYRNNNSVFLMASPARCPVTGIALDYGASEAVPRNISVACPNTPYYNVSSPSSVNVYQCPGGYVATGINAFTNFDGSIIEGLGLFCSSNAFISQTVGSSLSVHGNLVQSANGGDWTLTLSSVANVFSNMNLAIGDAYQDVFSTFFLTLPNSGVTNISSTNAHIFLSDWQSGAIQISFTINYGTPGFDPTKLAYLPSLTFLGVSLGSIFGHLQFFNIPLNLVIDASIPATSITTRQTLSSTLTSAQSTISSSATTIEGTISQATSTTKGTTYYASSTVTSFTMSVASSTSTISTNFFDASTLPTSSIELITTSTSLSSSTTLLSANPTSTSDSLISLTSLKVSTSQKSIETTSSTTSASAGALGSNAPVLFLAIGIGGGVVVLAFALVLILRRRKYHHFSVNLPRSLRKREAVNTSANALIPQRGNSFSAVFVPMVASNDPNMQSGNIILVPQGIIQMQPMGSVIVRRSGSNQSFNSIGRYH